MKDQIVAVSKQGTLLGNLTRGALYRWNQASLTRRGADHNILERYLEELRRYKICVITARPVGFFSLWLGVVGQLYACKLAGVTPIVYFNRSCFYWDDQQPEKNVWQYYFEPVSTIRLEELTHLTLDQTSHMAEDELRACISNREVLVDSRYLHGLIPEYAVHDQNRSALSHLIRDYITLQPSVQHSTHQRNISLTGNRRFVSVHVRGTAKSEDLKYQYRGVLPLTYYWREIDRYVTKDPQLAVYLATDSEDIVSRFVQRYGDRLITSRVQRSAGDRGEIHVQNGTMHMGLEVLADCLLLMQGVVLVHGVSNVSFAAAYWNSTLPHIDIYQRHIWQSRLRWFIDRVPPSMGGHALF